MRIDISFDNGTERFMVLFVALLVLAAVFFAGSAVVPSEAHAEWNSESSFGDSYYLRSMAETLDRDSGIFYDIYTTLDALENKLYF
jgi:hypothetical protein